MAFGNPDFSQLTAYTDQNTDLLADFVLNTDELKHVSIRTGAVAARQAINVFNGTITEQDRDCNLADAGTLAFDQVVVDVDAKAIAQTLCPQDATEFWLAERMRPGADGATELPFEEVMASYIGASIQKNISDFIGQQLIAQVTADGIDAGQSAASNVGTILDDLYDVYEALPAEIQLKSDVKIFMSPTYYRMALRAIVASGNGANMYHYNIENGTGDVFLPGTNALLVQSSGFIGSDKFVALSASQAIFVTGLMSDMENVRMIYDNIQDNIALRAYYVRGLGVWAADKAVVNGAAL
jgi:hypothetical protein